MEKQRFEPTVLGQVRGRTWEICHLFSGKILVGFNPFFEGMLACVFGWYSYNLNDTSTKTAEASLIARNYIYIYIVFKNTCRSPLKMCFLKPQPYHLEKTHNLQQCHPTRKGHTNKETGQVPQTGWSENGGFEPPLEPFRMMARSSDTKWHINCSRMFCCVCSITESLKVHSRIIDHHWSSFVIGNHQEPEQSNISLLELLG